MTCPEIITPNYQQTPVDFGHYYFLHPEGRQLIYDWFQRAWAERECQQNAAFELFIFTWFAFNGWAACVTDADRDREIINALSADLVISDHFVRAMQNNQNLSTSVENFVELLPIFDVKSLRRQGILRTEDETRQERISYYFAQGAIRFEPRCWRRHNAANELIPADWGHILNAIYKVRCNLFHGFKAAHSEMDQAIVHSAYLVLVNFLAETDYLNLGGFHGNEKYAIG